MSIKVRDITINDEQVIALQHLKDVAGRKRFYAEFIANLYDPSIKCDVRSCASYIAGEGYGDDRLKDAFQLMLSLSISGIESHEYLGQDYVESVISEWDLRKN